MFFSDMFDATNRRDDDECYLFIEHAPIASNPLLLNLYKDNDGVRLSSFHSKEYFSANSCGLIPNFMWPEYLEYPPL